MDDLQAKMQQMGAQIVQGGLAQLAELDRQCENAREESEQLLLKILQDNKDTEYGRLYDFANIKTVDEYREKVPMTAYDNYAEYVERMLAGEKDLITVYPVVHYALTSGSVDNPKHIPVSQLELDIYSQYSSTLMYGVITDYFNKAKGRNPNFGRSLLTVEVKKMQLPNGCTKGPISAVAISKMEPMLPFITSTPKQAVYPVDGTDTKYLKARYGLQARDLTSLTSAFMTSLVDILRYIESDWEILVRDIEQGTIDSTIKLPDEVRAELEAALKPDPERAAELRAEFEKGFEDPIIPRIWPQMDYISAIGTGGFSIYTDKMRQYSGDIPIWFSVYAASEGLFAVARYMEEGQFVLIPSSGFYEFIPADSEDESKTCTIDQLEVGKEYEIVVTNLSGFYRYRIGDVVRMLGYEKQSPKVAFVYRKNQMVNIAGEKTTEEHVAWTVKEFSKLTGEEIIDFCVYQDDNTAPSRYIVLLEPGRHLPKAKHEEYRAIVDEKLGFANPSLGTKVKTGVLSPTEIMFLQQETNMLYRDMMVMKGTSPNQLKPVRLLNTPAREKFFFALEDKED